MDNSVPLAQVINTDSFIALLKEKDDEIIRLNNEIIRLNNKFNFSNFLPQSELAVEAAVCVSIIGIMCAPLIISVFKMK